MLRTDCFGKVELVLHGTSTFWKASTIQFAVPVTRDLAVGLLWFAATCQVLTSDDYSFLCLAHCINTHAHASPLTYHTTCIISLCGALQVVVNDHVSKAVTLVNAGSLMYEYHWKLSAAPHLAVTPLAGSVGPGARALCKLTFNPTAAQQLNQHKVTCQVINGRSYSLLLSGQSYLFCLGNLLLCYCKSAVTV